MFAYPRHVKSTHSRVHEDEVHLHEGENHLQKWIDAAQNLVTWRANWDFKERTELQTDVNH